jgi:K+-sensing histidine kinase KdpD
MRIQNSKSWVKYSFGQACTGSSLILFFAFMVRYALQPLIEPYAPFHFFIVACLFIAYIYGYQFALLATLISAFLGSFFFVKPYLSFDVTTTNDIIQFINFSVVTVISILMIERLQRTIFANQLVLKVMESRHKISLYKENDRIYFSKKSSESSAILEEILTEFDDIIFLKYAGGNIKPEPLFLALAETDQVVLQTDEWQQFIHPDDLGNLLTNLHQAAIKPGSSRVFKLRFSKKMDVAPVPVQLEAYEFLGKPLKILRLISDS